MMELVDTQIVASASVQVVTLALSAFYCAVVYAFRVSLGGSKAQRERFERLAAALAVLIVFLAVTKAVGFVAGAAAGFTAFAIVILQVVAIRAAGSVTLQKELAAAVVQAKRSAVAMGALVGAPVILLFTGAHPVRDEVMAYLLVAEAVTLAGWFLVRTLGLFVRQKVSVLVWILYLCSVEVVPAWAVIVVAGRVIS